MDYTNLRNYNFSTNKIIFAQVTPSTDYFLEVVSELDILNEKQYIHTKNKLFFSKKKKSLRDDFSLCCFLR